LVLFPSARLGFSFRLEADHTA